MMRRLLLLLLLLLLFRGGNHLYRRLSRSLGIRSNALSVSQKSQTLFVLNDETERLRETERET